MKKVYFYEIGCCRGDNFINKVSLPLTTLVSFAQQVLKVKDRTERYDLIEQLSESLFNVEGDEYHDYARSDMATKLVNADFCRLSDEDLKQRLTDLQKGKRFSIELEESSIGVGMSKDDAKLAFSEINQSTDDDWI